LTAIHLLQQKNEEVESKRKTTIPSGVYTKELGGKSEGPFPTANAKNQGKSWKKGKKRKSFLYPKRWEEIFTSIESEKKGSEFRL